jgi:hypothetical protein
VLENIAICPTKRYSSNLINMGGANYEKIDLPGKEDRLLKIHHLRAAENRFSLITNVVGLS